MLSSFSGFSFTSVIYRTSKPKTLHQRLKFYSRDPNFVLKTKIRPPNLNEQNIQFPIRIPMRYRHQFKLQKQLKGFVNDTSKIHWDRLQPNQILLGFENIQYLSFKEIVQGLQTLSKIEGQQQHDWNNHQWVSVALNKVNQNFAKIKTKDLVKFYNLMKKLNCKNQEFWKKLYQKIQKDIYDLNSGQFSYFFINYYDNFEKYFSQNARKNFNKLMEGKIRQFSPEAIVKIFQFYLKDNKIDNYWLQNIFASLFKDVRYVYKPNQLSQIFRTLMIIGHEHNQRLYDNLYKRLSTVQFKTIQQIQLMKQVLEQVKQIFTSHRVQSSLKMLQQRKEQLSQKLKQTSAKTIQQIVKDDLRYFIQKRKLKQSSI